MRIVIFGSDRRALAMGRLLAEAEYHVCFGDAEGMDPLEAEQAGARADTVYHAAATCDMLIFAGPREQMDELLARVGRVSPQTVIIDAMEGELPNGKSGPELLARRLDTHRVVRALIVLPQVGANILYCGDDDAAMNMVEEVFRTAGCVTTDRGPLANASEIEAPPDADESSFETLKAANTVASA